MEFLSLSRRRSSARNVPSGEERGETDVFAGYPWYLIAARMYNLCQFKFWDVILLLLISLEKNLFSLWSNKLYSAYQSKCLFSWYKIKINNKIKLKLLCKPWQQDGYNKYVRKWKFQFVTWYFGDLIFHKNLLCIHVSWQAQSDCSIEITVQPNDICTQSYGRERTTEALVGWRLNQVLSFSQLLEWNLKLQLCIFRKSTSPFTTIARASVR